ncbi:hypothetical protein BHAOGJBA_4499 [Methylobacterium hispanicum]|uniref:Uncharacterized protein n=1 Tax=Methylobacterium hispanicum TaxID=270350 RepID=A0AAV4ZSM2_9HYPH|nr:hypothetical protein [Methylobacterium hispanicum]GJD90955.1 hypothetical protein BHAOGJBA_4499 [Methylobacterium hispanicum]
MEAPDDAPAARSPVPSRERRRGEEHYRLLEAPEIVSGPVVARSVAKAFGDGGVFLLVLDPLEAAGVAFRDASALLASGRFETRHPFLLFRHVDAGAGLLFLWNTVGGLVAETHEEGSEGAAALLHVMAGALVRHGSPLAAPPSRTAVRTDRLHPRSQAAADAVSQVLVGIHLAVLEADRVVPGPEPDGGCYLPEVDDGLHALCIAAWRRLGGRAARDVHVVPVVVGPAVLSAPEEDLLRMAMDAAAFGAATAVGDPAARAIDFAPGPASGRGPSYAVVCGLLRNIRGSGVCDGLQRLYDLPWDAPERVWWEAAFPGVHLSALQEEIDAACEEEADCLPCPVDLATLSRAVGRASARVLDEVLRPRAERCRLREGATAGGSGGVH